MRLGTRTDDGTSGSIHRALVGAFSLFALLAATLWAAPAADAAGKPGTAYVLDIARGQSSGTIYKLNSITGTRQGTVPSPWGPGVSGFLNPVGLVVDAQGYLIVAVSDGYNTHSTYPNDSQYYACQFGCGAVLRINPDTGQSVVLTKGPYITNPFGVLLPPDNDITDNDNNYLLVTDNGNSEIVRVDLNGGLGANTDSNQTVVVGQPAAGRDLFKPWGIARNGSQVLVVNTGRTDIKAFGHIGRYNESGGFLSFAGTVKSGDFRYLRGITFGLGAFYATDPFASDPTSGSEAGGRIVRPSGSGVDFVTAFNLMRTPSGLDFDYRSKYLLVADENGSQPSKVVRVNPDGGAQRILAADIGSNAIDVAVDRRKAPKPTKPPKKKIRPLASFERDQNTNFGARDGSTGRAVGDGALRIVNLTRGARLRLKCASSLCRRKLGTRKPIDQRADKSFHLFDFKLVQTGRYLTGRFMVIHYVPRGKLRGYRYASTFREYVFRDGRFDRVREGCLKPGKRDVSRRAITKCP